MPAYTPLKFSHFEQYSRIFIENHSYDNNGYAKEILAKQQIAILSRYLHDKTLSRCLDDTNEPSNDAEKMVLARLRYVSVEISKLYKTLKRKNTPPLGRPNMKIMTLDEHDPYNHDVLDQINQVLGRIRLIYLPKNFGVKTTPVQPRQTLNEAERKRYEQAHSARFPLLSAEDYALSNEQKLNDFLPLIDQLSGHKNKCYRNLGAALMGFFVAAVVLLVGFAYPAVSAAILATIPTSGWAGAGVAASVTGSGVLGLGLFINGKQKGLSKAVDTLTKLPIPPNAEPIIIEPDMDSNSAQSATPSPAMFKEQTKLRKMRSKETITLELALKILTQDSSLSAEERNISFNCGKYNYSSLDGSVVDISSMRIVDGVGAVSRTALMQTQDMEANRQALIKQLQSAIDQQAISTLKV
ncbi:MAG: hypothetical protein ACO1N3_04490 [Gammaproteobacteria bacterium]